LSEEGIPPETIDIINRLRAKIRNNNGKIPSPLQDPEFWKDIDTLRTVYRDVFTWGKIVKILGLGKEKIQKMATYYKRFKKYGDKIEERLREIKEREAEMSREEMGEEEAEPTPEEAEAMLEGEEEVPKILIEIIRRYVLKHMGKTIDKKVAVEVAEMMDIGDVVKTKYMAACMDMGYIDLKTCVDNALDFFIKYRDRVDALEEENETLRKSIDMITDFISDPDKIREALVKILEKWSAQLIYMGYPPEYVLKTYNSILQALIGESLGKAS